MSLQEKFTKENVIYKITQDLDLSGETLTIPNGCKLDFQGGSFSNGTLANVSKVESNYTCFKGITFENSSVKKIQSVWFNLDGEDVSDEFTKMFSMLNDNCIVSFESKLIKQKSIISIKKSNVTIENLNCDVSGSEAFLDLYSNNITIKNCTFNNGGQVIRLFTANNITVKNCTFNNTGYGIIQQKGYVSNNVLIDGCIITNANLDFIEANCTSSAKSKNWTVVNNIFKNSKNYPTTATESRFVGFTAVENVVISNNTVENVAGDAMVHLEDVGNTAIISNNIFNNCAGHSYIYVIHSQKDVLISNNIFKQTDESLPTKTIFSTAAERKSNVRFDGNQVIGNNGNLLLGIILSSITNNIFKQCGRLQLYNCHNIDIRGNIFEECEGIVGEPGASGNAGTNMSITNNKFISSTSEQCIKIPLNTNGTGWPTDLIIKNNKFDKTISIYAKDCVITDNVFSDGSVSTGYGSTGIITNNIIQKKLYNNNLNLNLSSNLNRSTKTIYLALFPKNIYSVVYGVFSLGPGSTNYYLQRNSYFSFSSHRDVDRLASAIYGYTGPIKIYRCTVTKDEEEWYALKFQITEDVQYDFNITLFKYYDGTALMYTATEASSPVEITPTSYSTSGTFASKPQNPPVGTAYFCTDKQTTEGSTNGIMIYHKGSNTWVDALGRTIS